jgi:hypothetical protein
MFLALVEGKTDWKSLLYLFDWENIPISVRLPPPQISFFKRVGMGKPCFPVNIFPTHQPVFFQGCGPPGSAARAVGDACHWCIMAHHYINFRKIPKMAIEIVDLPMKNGDFP